MTKESTDGVGKNPVPAYVAFPTFLNFIDGYAGDAGLPDHIDKSLMPTMSGGTQNHLMAALKALSLIEDDGTTTAEFKLLVKAREDEAKWKGELKSLIDTAYKGIADSNSLAKLTPKKLQDSFRLAGATGSTNGRAIRFYLSAIKECGIDVPRFLLKASSGGASTPRRKVEAGHAPAVEPLQNSEKPKGGDDGHRHDGKHRDQEGFASFPVFLGANREGRIVFPTDLNSDDYPKFEAAIIYLKALAESKK